MFYCCFLFFWWCEGIKNCCYIQDKIEWIIDGFIESIIEVIIDVLIDVIIVVKINK